MFLRPMAESTIESASERTLPTVFDETWIVSSKPLKRIPELPAIFVGGDCSDRRTARRGSAGLVFPFDQLEFIHKLGITDDGVDGGGREVFVFRSKLGKEILVSRMQTPKEQHHLKNRGDGHRRARECTHVAFEA